MNPRCGRQNHVLDKTRQVICARAAYNPRSNGTGARAWALVQFAFGAIFLG